MIKGLIDKALFKILHRSRINRSHRIPAVGIPILAYHEIARNNFESHVSYLKSMNYRIISMNEFTEYFYSRTNNTNDLILLTFDDGWKSNYTEIFPIICKHQIPVLIYIISAVYLTDYKPFFIQIAELKSSGIKNIPCEDILSGYHDDLRNNIVRELYSRSANKIIKCHTLSSAEIKDMTASGYVSFGSHTVSHPNFNHISIGQAEIEISKSKRDIESLVNRSIDHFAYPEGCYSAKHLDIIRRTGYMTAATTIPGWNNPRMGTNPLELRRIFISAKDDVSILSAKLSGLWYKIHRAKFLFY